MNKKIAALTVLFFLIFSQGVAKSKKSAEGQDVKLSQIDELIKKTEYDRALELLNVYIAANPGDFDNAQKRIKSILHQRLQYAQLADKLIQMIVNEPENSKEIYEIISELEKYERHPSDANLQFIADVKKSAQFNYFRALFMDIQAQASKLTSNEQYAASMEKIREGFWLYKDDFYEHWESKPEFIKSSEGILASLEKNISQFEARDYIPKINDNVQKFISQVNADLYKEADQTFVEIQRQFLDLNSLRQRIFENCRDFSRLFEKTKEIDSDSTDASYLPFMIYFINGIGSIEKSGLLGTVDGLWDTLVSKMNTAAFAQVSRVYRVYAPRANKAGADYESVLNYAALENKVIALYNIRQGAFQRTGLAGANQKIENPLQSYKTLCDYLIKLTLQTENFKKLNVQLTEVQQRQAVLLEALLADGDKGGKKNEDTVAEVFKLMSFPEDVAGNKSDHELSSAVWAKDYNALSNPQWVALSDIYESLVDDFFAKSINLQVEGWKAVSHFYMRKSDSFVSEARRTEAAGKLYYEGFCTKIAAADYSKLKKTVSVAVDYASSYEPSADDVETAKETGLYFRYPNIAQNVFSLNTNSIDGYLNKISDSQKLITDSYQNKRVWTENEEITAIVQEDAKYLAVNTDILLELKNLSVNEGALAKSRSFQAALLKNEGDSRFEEAQNALKKKDYQLARRKLQDALSKYDESLDNQNDEELRAECDKKLFALGERITREENEFVVVEVRNLKTLAKDAYFNGRFDDAEKYLTQARSRWADTNVTEDEEITNLMSFVNTAVSMNTGREILPSYPQYPEMSQLLDMSYQYYNSGKQKYEQGNKKDGDVDLNKALQSIQKLQYVYPLNQKASILTLKINKLKDPQKFKEEFSQKIDAAKFMCKGADTRQEGYANLLDYYEIEPDYPGLKKLIYQTEIEIGIRQRPLDNSSEKKAKNLYAEAKKLYSNAGNDKAKLEDALSKINQSLSLNSDDKEAMKLKDQITTKIGGSAPTVLSTEDERLYQLAIQRLQNNNIAGADAIVARLLKKSQNMNSQKIKDLKIKIDARS